MGQPVSAPGADRAIRSSGAELLNSSATTAPVLSGADKWSPTPTVAGE